MHMLLRKKHQAALAEVSTEALPTPARTEKTHSDGIFNQTVSATKNMVASFLFLRPFFLVFPPGVGLY